MFAAHLPLPGVITRSSSSSSVCSQFATAIIGTVAVAAAAIYIGAIAAPKIAVRRSRTKQASQEEEQEQQN